GGWLGWAGALRRPGGGGGRAANGGLAGGDGVLGRAGAVARPPLATIAPEPFFYRDDEVTAWFAAAAEAAHDRGLEVATGPWNIRDGVRWNAAFAYIEPARSRTNLTIRANAHVERVGLGCVRATGAVVDGETLEADVVVLSAGAVGSPRTLLRSGIDAGTNLQDPSPRSSRSRRPTRSAPRRRCRSRAASSRRRTCTCCRSSTGTGGRAHITVALLRPHSRGRVALDS